MLLDSLRVPDIAKKGLRLNAQDDMAGVGLDAPILDAASTKGTEKLKGDGVVHRWCRL